MCSYCQRFLFILWPSNFVLLDFLSFIMCESSTVTAVSRVLHTRAFVVPITPLYKLLFSISSCTFTFYDLLGLPRYRRDGGTQLNNFLGQIFRHPFHVAYHTRRFYLWCQKLFCYHAAAPWLLQSRTTRTGNPKILSPKKLISSDWSLREFIWFISHISET